MSENKIETNLSVSPYFDDFSPEKKFVKVLFVPALAVQTREMNQLQTILQNQISRFANHMFKDGSIVEGVPVTYIPNQKYIRLKNTFNTDPARSIGIVSNTHVLVSNNGVRAVPKIAVRGFESQYPDTNMIYLDYIKTGKDIANNDVSQFTAGETITLYSNQNALGTLDANNIVDTISLITANTGNAVGTAYAVSIGDGIVYQKGYFVKVTPQIALVRKHDTLVNNHVVGFDTIETIITEESDSTLFDNANGESNFNAPGAHRLRLDPVLISKNKDEIRDTNSTFLPVIEFDDKAPVQEIKQSIYADIGDAIAQGRNDDGGDFVVKPFSVETLEHEDPSKMYYAISPGIGYPKGYRVEIIGTKRVETNRATATDEAQAQIVSANYGSYVLVKQVVGMFDFDSFKTIQIYNVAQEAVSSFSAPGTTPTGTLVGTATVKSFAYDSGVKGSPDAIFRLYLGDIKMVSGYSFSSHAKAFYLSGTPAAKADAVIEAGNTVLKDTTADTLVFPIGINSVKRLTDLNGVNDTQFVFRDIVSGTLQSNGFVTFTLNTPHAGGNERLNFGVGPISDANESQITIATSAAFAGANQTGTVSATASNTLTGSGTVFTTAYKVGGSIILGGTTARNITAIANNTSMTVDGAALTVSGVTHAPYFKAGAILDLSGVSGSINVISNTQFSVSTSIATTAPVSVYAQYPVLRTNAVPMKKNIQKDVYVKLDLSANTSGPWNLGLTDIVQVNSVYVGTTYSNTNPDRVSLFMAGNGQTPIAYEHGKLFIKPEFSGQLDASTKLLVRLSRFEANTSAGVGFFSADSYPIQSENDTANSTNVSVGLIPKVLGTDAREVIDFRPRRFNTANVSFTIAGASVNPAAANTSYDIVSGGSYLIESGTNFQADVEFYLPRRDVLAMTKEGTLVVRTGVPSLHPRTPINGDDAMAIAEIFVPGYPSLTTREGEVYSRSDISVKSTLVTNKRYSHRDVGVLDKRIKRLEYQVSLNSLEQAAKDLTITDANGLDRFKNGIYVNPFNSHLLGRVSDFEYKISIDRDRGMARPYFKDHSIDYAFNEGSSSNIEITGSVVSLPYESQIYISQPYASKFRNCTESVWQWKGEMSIHPGYDHFKDESALPAVNVEIDTSAPWEEFANSPFGTIYGDWRTTSSSSNTSQSASWDQWTGGTAITTTTTTQTNQQRDGNQIRVDAVTENYNFGSFVKDISLNPYMRSRVVAFVAHGLKPNTRIYGFFDGVPVSDSIAPGVLSGISNPAAGREEDIVNQSGAYGSALVSNENGTVIGLLRIPAEKFRVGDRIFELTNVDDLVTGSDAKLCSAKSTYTASNLSVSTQELTLGVTQPKITTSAFTENNVIISSNTTTQIIMPPQQDNDDGGSGDPIAQSFLVNVPTSATGTFIDRLGLFFRSKDNNLGVTVYLLEMNGGNPDSSKVVASKHLNSNQIVTSNDASAETIFDFDGLPYLTRGAYYSFMVKPDGDSPEYTIWISEVGGTDIVSNRQIFSNPYIGVMFVSANAMTWTAIQNEDIKFNLYRAKFTALSGTVVFENENDDYLTVVGGLTNVSPDYSVLPGDEVYTASGGIAQTTPGMPFGYVQSFNPVTNELILDSSTGGFTAGAAIQIHRRYLDGTSSVSNTTLIATTTIASVNDIEYSAIVPRFAFIEPSATAISMKHTGADTSYNADAPAYSVVPEMENEKFDKIRVIGSRSNTPFKTSKFSITLTSEDDFVSPIIGLNRKSALAIENIINNDLTNEHTRFGKALSKFISPEIVLAEGQDSEDLEVYLTAHRPFGSDLTVYAKFLNAEDGASIDDKVWTKLDMTMGTGVYSANGDNYDFREFKFGIPSVAPVATAGFLNGDGLVQYADANGSVYIGYKKLLLKVVLTAANKYNIPVLNDIMSISLML